jgi:hypothetical protein
VRRPIALAVLLAALVVPGCRQGLERYPPECSNGPGAVRAALAKAPDGDVSIEGTRLSECLVKNQDPGPLAAFGGSVISVSQRLGDRAERGDKRALLELGYLHGAVQRGADATVHDELKFRLDQELLRVNTRSPEFRRGDAAGRARG